MPIRKTVGQAFQPAWTAWKGYPTPFSDKLLVSLVSFVVFKGKEPWCPLWFSDEP